jgi:hypothetical protein
VRRRIFICAFTTTDTVDGSMLHLKTVRADNPAQATGIIMSWVWSHNGHHNMFRLIEWREQSNMSIDQNAYYGDPAIVEPKSAEAN